MLYYSVLNTRHSAEEYHLGTISSGMEALLFLQLMLSTCAYSCYQGSQFHGMSGTFYHTRRTSIQRRLCPFGSWRLLSLLTSLSGVFGCSLCHISKLIFRAVCLNLTLRYFFLNPTVCHTACGASAKYMHDIRYQSHPSTTHTALK